MNQCVPSWDVGDNSAPSKIKFHNHSNSPQDVPSLEYEVAEPTRENGQLAMHGLGVPRVVNEPAASNCPPTWDKPRAGGTLESIVSQATCYPLPMPRAGGSSSVTVTMDALVPCNNNNNQERPTRCSTRVGSCSGAAAPIDGGAGSNRVTINRCQTNGSVSESATCGGRDSHTQRSLDTWERELGLPGFTSTSLASTENTFSGHTKTSGGDDRDSISHHSRSQASDRKMMRRAKEETTENPEFLQNGVELLQFITNPNVKEETKSIKE